MKKTLSTHEAKTHLSKVIEEVLAGAEVVICRGKSPVVKVVKYHQADEENARPKVGIATSAPVTYNDDAFAPLSNAQDLESWGVK